MHVGAHKYLYTPIEPFKTQLLTHAYPHTVIDSPSGTPTNAFTDRGKFRYSIYIQETDTHVPLITLMLTHRSMQISPNSRRCAEQLHIHTLKKLYTSRDNIQTQTHMCACYTHAVTPDYTHLDIRARKDNTDPNTCVFTITHGSEAHGRSSDTKPQRNTQPNIKQIPTKGAQTFASVLISPHSATFIDTGSHTPAWTHVPSISFLGSFTGTDHTLTQNTRTSRCSQTLKSHGLANPLANPNYTRTRTTPISSGHRHPHNPDSCRHNTHERRGHTHTHTRRHPGIHSFAIRRHSETRTLVSTHTLLYAPETQSDTGAPTHPLPLGRGGQARMDAHAHT